MLSVVLFMVADVVPDTPDRVTRSSRVVRKNAKHKSPTNSKGKWLSTRKRYGHCCIHVSIQLPEICKCTCASKNFKYLQIY